MQVGTQLLPAAPSSNRAPEQTLSHNPGLWRSRPAYLALPHTLEKDAEVMFSHALRDGQGHQFILHSYWAACQAGQQKARKRFGPWFGCSWANPPMGSPMTEHSSLLCRASPWAQPPATATSLQPGPGHQLHLKSQLRYDAI